MRLNLAPSMMGFIMAALSLALAVLGFHVGLDPQGAPPLDSLEVASGRVAWVSYRNRARDVWFRLESTGGRMYSYSSKAEASHLVREAIERSGNSRLTILYDPDKTYGPMYSDERAHPVYEVSQEGVLVRSYEEVDAAYRSDNRLGFYMGVIFAVLALYFLGCAFRRPS